MGISTFLIYGQLPLLDFILQILYGKAPGSCGAGLGSFSFSIFHTHSSVMLCAKGTLKSPLARICLTFDFAHSVVYMGWKRGSGAYPHQLGGI